MTTKKKKKEKKEKKKLARIRGINRHHIIPSSQGGTDKEDNIVMIDARRHEIYHWLFKNKKPDDIINYLIDYFWNGQDMWVFEAIAKRRTKDERTAD